MSIQSSEPWNEVGMSRATFYRQRSPLSKAKSYCKKHPEIAYDVDREEMCKRLENKMFAPNWYRSGLECREAALQLAMQKVNKSKSVASTGLGE